MNKDNAEFLLSTIGAGGTPSHISVNDEAYIWIIASLYANGFIKEFDWETELGAVILKTLTQFLKESAKSNSS